MVNEGESNAVAGKQAAKEEKKLSRCALVSCFGFLVVKRVCILFYHLQVTGANKGIGYGLVRALCKKFKGTVYLTGKL